MSFKVDLNEKLAATGDTGPKSGILNVGYFILQRIYHNLKIKYFFHKIQDITKIPFDCNAINRFLSFASILEPRSKLGTFDRLDSYNEQPSFDYQHILCFMDLLKDNYDSYLEHLFLNSGN